MWKFTTIIFLLSIVVSGGCGRADQPHPASATNPGKGGDASADLKWAKDIVEAFFTAVRDTEYSESTKLIGGGEDYSNRVRQMGVKSWVIKSEEMAPGKNEASFRGTYVGSDTDVSGKTKEYEFLIRVVKQQDSGLWRINFISDSTWRGRR
jgi:hypothetical protein